MAASSWDESIRRVLADEGGYTNHPSDPGGPTNWGITIHDARRYWKRNATAGDVRQMPLSVARKIYWDSYWSALRCNELPAGLDYAVFDYGVNSGIGRAAKVLRRILNLPDQAVDVTDSVIATARRIDAATAVHLLCAERLTFLQHLKTWPVFGAGWARRVNGVESAARAMARMEPGRPPDTASFPPPRERAEPSPQVHSASAKGVVPPPRAARQGALAVIGVIAAAGAMVASSPVMLMGIGVSAAMLIVLSHHLLKRWHRSRQEAAVRPIPSQEGMP